MYGNNKINVISDGCRYSGDWVGGDFQGYGSLQCNNGEGKNEGKIRDSFFFVIPNLYLY